MHGLITYQFKSYIRSFKIIPPAATFLVWIVVLYHYSGVEILSSYAVSSIVLYLVTTWISMNLCSMEEEAEKNMLFVQVGKIRYLLGKWIISMLIAIVLMLFAISYPILLDSFKEAVQPIHLGLSILIHLLLAIFGILVGSFSSITSFIPKRYTWLSAVLIIAITLSYDGIVEQLSLLKWVFIIFPPVVNVINFFEPDDVKHFGKEFCIISSFALLYSIIAFSVLLKLFLKEES
ncbi:hypothetical protein [Psychrobacillus soli]|uniref:ABC transporter permease n=1 Tax=Psychrobacillus soli TaxID=1543965 RepID=A0A544TG49_9BACI|nr:hypothetical protein [Psychrobacillus soli]TQR16396.1 hypothetical protein FG383_06675 [Psychrobacillus soli]